MDQRVIRLCCELEDKSRDVDPYRRQRADRINNALKNSKGDWQCQLCGLEFKKLDDVTLDHVVPLSLMKDDEEEILQLACRSCNSERGNMPIMLYRMFRAVRKQHPHHVIDAFTRLRRKREHKQEVTLGIHGHRRAL